MFLSFRNPIFLKKTKMMRTYKKRSFEWTWTARLRNSSWQRKIGPRCQLSHFQAVAVYWAETGPAFSLTKWRKATHGAVCVSRIITWDRKTRVRCTRPCFSGEGLSASIQSAALNWDSWLRRITGGVWMWPTSVTSATLAIPRHEM